MTDSRFARDHVYDVDARILMPDTALHDAKKNSRRQDQDAYIAQL